MKRILPFLFILFLLIGCNQRENNTIKIGAIFPLTGDAAAWGIPPRNGAKLAVDEINKTGGINGKKIKLVIEDDACDATKAVNAANKLISIDNPVAIVGAVCSGSTLAIAPYANKNKIVLISPASTDPAISNAGDYLFRDIPSDEYRAKVFAQYIVSNGHRKAAILYINNQPGKSAEQNFTKYFERDGGRVNITESYDAQTNDVITQLTKIRNAKSDFILSISQINDAVIVMKNIKELNIKTPIYFLSEALDDPSVRKNAGNAADGVTFITFAKTKNKEHEDFLLKYKKKYGKDPGVFASEAFDAVNILAKVCSTMKEITGENIKNALYKIQNYQGASGNISFDKNGDVEKALAIKKIAGNETKVVVIK